MSPIAVKLRCSSVPTFPNDRGPRVDADAEARPLRVAAGKLAGGMLERKPRSGRSHGVIRLVGRGVDRRRVLPVDPTERLVKIKTGEELATGALPERGQRDDSERSRHQDVPLPPRCVPVSGECDRDHRLCEQDPRGGDAEQNGASASADPATSSEARKRPTGVATTKPVFLCSTKAPGVASAWRPREPALARKASETRKIFASPRRVAASLVSAPSATLTADAPGTSQKCAG